MVRLGRSTLEMIQRRTVWRGVVGLVRLLVVVDYRDVHVLEEKALPSRKVARNGIDSVGKLVSKTSCELLRNGLSVKRIAASLMLTVPDDGTCSSPRRLFACHERMQSVREIRS